MNLYGRDLHRLDGVAQRVAGVGVRAGIEDDAVGGVPGAVDGVDQRALMVRLVGLQAVPQLLRPFATHLLDLRQGRRSVHLRATGAEQVQVGSVQEEDPHDRPA